LETGAVAGGDGSFGSAGREHASDFRSERQERCDAPEPRILDRLGLETPSPVVFLLITYREIRYTPVGYQMKNGPAKKPGAIRDVLAEDVS
jgi:hypothetical protein